MQRSGKSRLAFNQLWAPARNWVSSSPWTLVYGASNSQICVELTPVLASLQRDTCPTSRIRFADGTSLRRRSSRSDFHIQHAKPWSARTN